MEKLSNKQLNIKIDQSLLDSMKKEYLSCKKAIDYVSKLGLDDAEIDNNIDKLYEFARDIKYCSRCPGIKNCKKENPYVITNLINDYGFLTRQLNPCKKLREKAQFLGEYGVRDFPDEWLENSIDTIDDVKCKTVLAQKFIDHLMGKNKLDRWLYLNGKMNSGRSYLAATFTVVAASKKMGPICYLNTSKRTKDLYNYSLRMPEKFNQLMDMYCNCPILVFDDFGNEYKNDFVRDAVVFEIISKRHASDLLTIFTSDFTIKEIEQIYSTSKAASIRARQIANILKDACKCEINLSEYSAQK